MAHLLKFTILLSIFSQGLAGLAYGIAEVNDDHPGKCWVSKEAKAFAPGATWPMDDGFCGIVSCDELQGKLYLQFTTCGKGSIGSYPVCHDVAIPSVPYPRCCPVKMCVTPEQLERFTKEGGYEVIS